MPVYAIVCPDCGQTSRSLVLDGCKMPSEWVCSACGGRRGRPVSGGTPEPHPWESGRGAACLCCGGTSARVGACEEDATGAR